MVSFREVLAGKDGGGNGDGAGRAGLPATGTALAARLAQSHAGEDWIAALAKGAVMPRGEIEAVLASDAPLPDAVRKAAGEMEALLTPPDRDATDHVFAADTNDKDAQLEIDREAGLSTLPNPQEAPTRTGSAFEQGSGRNDADKTL